MDSVTVELYLQKIEEFVHDEDKIITLKWLTTALDINVSDTKKILQQYVSDQRDIKPDALSVTYVLSGTLKDKTLGITVVKENELEDKEDLFDTVLNKEIYSIQKNKDIDLNTVSMVDYFDVHNPKEAPPDGSIISKASVKRVFKQKKALPPPREPTIKGKISVFTKIPPKTSEKIDTTSASPKQNGVKDVPKVSTKPKQNGLGIASFFNKSLSQGDAKPKTQEKPIKTEIKAEEKLVAQKKPESVKDSKTDRFKNLIDSDSETEESHSQSQNVTSKPSKENQKPKRNNKRPRKENKKNAPSPKRRRRIVEQQDSDDDIFGNDDDGDEIMQEDSVQISEEESEPLMLPKAPLPPKNKKRKLIDRTYTDEEGFIITRKEWAEESASEDEVEIKSEIKAETEVKSDKPDLKRKELENGNVTENKKLKKEINDSPNDKVVNGKAKGPKGKKAVATNQPTLMNFFKRS